MGDPKKRRKRYATPAHPWNATEIEENREYRKEYGLRIKKEILIAASFLKKYKNLAKKLIASTTKQGDVEKEQIKGKLQGLGLLSAGAELASILNLQTKDILERRLQTLVFRKGLARSINQARQFIVHRHIMVNGKEITVPGYMVTLEEEANLIFKAKSALADEAHPERYNLAEKAKEEAALKEAIKKKAEPKVAEKTEVVAKEAKVKETPTEEKKEEATKEAEKVEEPKEVAA